MGKYLHCRIGPKFKASSSKLVTFGRTLLLGDYVFVYALAFKFDGPNEVIKLSYKSFSSGWMRIIFPDLLFFVLFFNMDLDLV